MTNLRSTSDTAGDGTTLPEELLAARDRVADGRARARRALGRGQARRRLLPQIAVISAVIATFGLADRFVQVVSAPTIASASPLASNSSVATSRALAQVSKTLAADQRVIAALASAQARLVQGASQDGGSQGGASSQLPSLQSVGSVPAISIPTFSAPPVVATTGASVVIP
jgi:hypothetical protein